MARCKYYYSVIGCGERESRGTGNVGQRNDRSVTSPTEEEIAQILGLKEKCEHRLGISIVLSGDFLRSLDNPQVGAFAFMNGGHFIGFVFFYSFEKEEAEACIFADPD